MSYPEEVMQEKTVEALRLMERSVNVVEDTHGNVSFRTGKLMAIKPSGLPYGLIADHEVPVLDIYSGEQSFSNMLPSVDSDNHREIYQALPWARSICHTHSPYATAFAMSGTPIRVCCTEQADYFGGDIPCLPFSGGFRWMCPEFPFREGPTGVLLGNHGALTISPSDDPRDAVRLAVALEMVAKKFHLALQVDLPMPILDDDVVSYHDRYRNRYGQKK